MYESYAWPGAATYKRERRTIVTWIKELIVGVMKKIDEVEKVR